MTIFGGGSAEVFSTSDFSTVESAIEEPQRAEAATQAMERINDQLEKLLDERAQYFEQLSDIDARVGSPEAEYDKVLGRLWRAREEAQASYVGEVFILRDNMTRDEWETVFGNANN